ncbi:MAG: uroporphyrinogen-III synthase [Bacteroidales bacterium]|nr:uroporphyrinogen-III synthase [Bacteroidales bacterium]
MKVKSLLISQPKPSDFEKSPYGELAKKHGVTIDFHKFITIEGVSSKDFRQDKISLADHTAVVMTSRNAVDHFFRMAKEMRYEVPETLKYFCTSESTAFYLQNYVQFRKRKIFHGKHNFNDLLDIIRKHKEEKFLLPCSDIAKEGMADLLEQNKIEFTRAVLYRTVASNLSHVKLENYDMVVFFSPAGIKSLQKNFPKFKQGEKIFGGFGKSTCDAIKEAGFTLHIEAPTTNSPSMTMAIDEFLTNEAKKNRKK